MASKTFSLIFSLLLITAFLCFTTTNATSRRLLIIPPGFDSSKSVARPHTGLVGAPLPPNKVPGHGSRRGAPPHA
nr:hypothetical protein Itr_chr07CG17490 [Ipomoea trifida]